MMNNGCAADRKGEGFVVSRQQQPWSYNYTSMTAAAASRRSVRTGAIHQLITVSKRLSFIYFTDLS